MITGRAPSIYDRLTALADPTRSRMLLLLDRHELTVGELGAALQLPQSTTSRHLKVLGDEGWVVSRAEGTSRRYRATGDRLDVTARQLWDVVRAQVHDTGQALQDRHRLEGVLADRRARQSAFFDGAAAQWDSMRAELIGQRTDLLALLALLDPDLVVGDLGSGAGHVTEALAPCVARVIAVDESGPMLDAASRRLESIPNVELRTGPLEALPVADEELDAAVMMLVASYLPEPGRAIDEASRALRDGGRLVVVDLLPHDLDDYALRMEHAWRGFDREAMTRWLEAARFTDVRYRPLPAAPDSKGPALFVASATKVG